MYLGKAAEADDSWEIERDCLNHSHLAFIFLEIFFILKF
jgi:hypothetical protein